MFSDSEYFSIADIADMLARMIFTATDTPFDRELVKIIIKIFKKIFIYIFLSNIN